MFHMNELIPNTSFDTIFIVDDNSIDNINTRTILISRSIAAEVKVFSEVNHALSELNLRKKLSSKQPDLILVNIHFNNISKYIELHDFTLRLNGTSIGLIPMATLSDKKFFKPLTDAGINPLILQKTADSEKIMDHLLKNGSSLLNKVSSLAN